MINLRGRVLPVIDLRRRFGLPSVPLSLDHRFVVARCGARALALRVDRVEEVIDVAANAVQSATRLIPGAQHAAGIVRLPDGVIVIQDLEALLSSEDEAQLEQALSDAPDLAGAGARREVGTEAVNPELMDAALDLVRRRTGLVFSQARRPAFESGLLAAMHRAGAGDLPAYLRALVDAPAALDELVAEITVGETYFLRDPGAMGPAPDPAVAPAARAR